MAQSDCVVAVLLTVFQKLADAPVLTLIGYAAFDTVVTAAISELIVYTLFGYGAPGLPEVARHAIMASVVRAVALLLRGRAVAALLRCYCAVALFLRGRAVVTRFTLQCRRLQSLN